MTLVKIMTGDPTTTMEEYWRCPSLEGSALGSYWKENTPRRGSHAVCSACSKLMGLITVFPLVLNACHYLHLRHCGPQTSEISCLALCVSGKIL